MLCQVSLLNHLSNAIEQFPTACASPLQVQGDHENTPRCMVSDGIVDITASEPANGQKQPWDNIALSGHFDFNRQQQNDYGPRYSCLS